MKQIIKISSLGEKTFIDVGDEDLSLETIKKNIGDSSGTGYVEFSYRQFPWMPEIVVACDEEGKLKDYPIGLITSREQFAGDVIICEIKRVNGENDLYGIEENKISVLDSWLNHVVVIRRAIL